MVIATRSIESTIAAVLNAERDRCHAVGARDWGTIERLLSDGFTYTHLNGITEDKATHIQGLKEKLNWMERENPPDVRLYGNVAILTGNLVRHFEPRGDRRIRREMVTLQVWVNENGNWQLVAHQGTELHADRGLQA